MLPDDFLCKSVYNDSKKTQTMKGGIFMVNYDSRGYRKLDMSKLASRKHQTMSSKEALRDVEPIKWSDDVLSGNKKVTIKKM